MAQPRLDRHRWPATWTWPAPRTADVQVPLQNGYRRIYYRRRLVDYAMEPEPRLTGELLRRGFLESA